MEIDSEGKATSVEEKPLDSMSSYAVPGRHL